MTCSFRAATDRELQRVEGEGPIRAKRQKAINLLMPVSVKRGEKKGAAVDTAESGNDKGGQFNVFMLSANWFSLEQTEGADFERELIVPTWDAQTALAALDVAQVPF